MQRFTDLKVWQRSHQLVLDVYRVTAGFPVEERFGITAQLRRAAVSIVSNIAEGSKRRTPLDYARMLNMAEGSSGEAEYHVMVSRDLRYLSPDEAQWQLTSADEVAKMLYGLRMRVTSTVMEDAPISK